MKITIITEFQDPAKRQYIDEFLKRINVLEYEEYCIEDSCYVQIVFETNMRRRLIEAILKLLCKKIVRRTDIEYFQVVFEDTDESYTCDEDGLHEMTSKTRTCGEEEWCS